MKIPLDYKFRNLEGNIFTFSGKPATPDEPHDHVSMKGVCVLALTAEFQEDTAPGKDFVSNKLNQFQLTKAFMSLPDDAKEIEITTEQATMLKQRIAKNSPVLIAGPAMLILDGKNPDT